MRQIKILVEGRPGQFVARPIGVKGARTGVGRTYEEALSSLRLPSRLYAESIATTLLSMRPPVVEACVSEAAESVSSGA